MQQIRIPRTDGTTGVLVPIACAPWAAFEPEPMRPVTADVRMAHDGHHLLLHYHVVEPELRRMCTHHNDEVWTDSCVELFLMNPAMDAQHYVNFEFSASSYVLVGRGTGRVGRVLYDPQMIDSAVDVQVQVLRNTASFDGIGSGSEWTLDASIDLAAFSLALPGTDIGGLALRGNLYKCGDKQAVPHYLSWNDMDTATPEFHNPRCFGLMELQA